MLKKIKAQLRKMVFLQKIRANLVHYRENYCRLGFLRTKQITLLMSAVQLPFCETFLEYRPLKYCYMSSRCCHGMTDRLSGLLTGDRLLIQRLHPVF